MKRLDSLYKKNEVIRKMASSPPPPPNFVYQKKSKPVVFPFYYFYRSLRVVLVMWILLLACIMIYPWANYFIKKSINPSQQVLGTAELKKAPEKVNSAPKQDPPSFYLKKDDLEINAPIVDGITDEDLAKGIGHHKDSVWPNQKGNVVLAGHNFSLDPENKYGEVFADLRDLAIGDQVTITYQNKKYTYKIFKRETVAAKDISLFGKSDAWQLTFYTCDPPKTDWRRLVFQAELIKIE